MPPKIIDLSAMSLTPNCPGECHCQAMLVSKVRLLHQFPSIELHQIQSVSRGQGGITCGAIDEPKKSSKAIDERVIINFRDKNVVIARFRDKNVYR